MKKLLPLLLIVFSLQQCAYNDLNSGSILIFKFTISPETDNGFWEENWVVVRDNKTGVLFGAKMVVGDEPVEFHSEKMPSDNKISVSLVRMGDTPIWSRNCSVTVYNGVDAGSEWTIAASTSNNISKEAAFVGKYTLSINNVPPVYSFGVSGASYYSSIANLNNARLTGLFSVYTDASKQLIAIDAEGPEKPKHVWLDPPNKGDVIELNYNNLHDFDDYLTINFTKTKKTRAGLVAYNAMGSYKMYPGDYFAGSNREIDRLDIGFLKEFSDYEFSLTLDEFNYRSRGPMPSSVTYSDYSGFTIDANSMTEYSLTTSRNYVYSVASFNKQGNTNAVSYNVTYYSPAGNAVHHDPLTPELIQRYRFPVDDLRYVGTGIMLSGRLYKDMLSWEFDPGYTRPAVYQWSWLGTGYF